MAPKQSAAIIVVLFQRNYLDRVWIDAPGILVLALFLMASIVSMWWLRDRESKQQRRVMRLLNQVSEEIIASNSPNEILSRLQAILPRISEGLQCSLHLYNRVTKTLDVVVGSAHALPVAIRADAPLSGLQSAVALCFRNRTLIAVSDSSRSPFTEEPEKKPTSRSLVVVPMFAQAELAGVMVVSHLTKANFFSDGEQTAMQHLGNQVAAAIRFQEQKSNRERMFRSEKLAASGQLISGIVGELRSPLKVILELSGSIMNRAGAALQPELALIEAEALRASEIVNRLVAFGQTGQVPAKPLDIHALLTGILLLRPQNLTQPGVKMVTRFVNRSIQVMGSHSQLEQVFLTIFRHAEKAAALSPDPSVTVITSLLAHRVLVEVAFSTVSEAPQAELFENSRQEHRSMGMGLSRGVMQSHGGDIRLVQVASNQFRFELEMPVLETSGSRTESSPAKTPSGRRQLTALLVEPDTAMQRQVVDLIAKRGDRVVPVGSAEEAAELAERLYFDLTFCTTQLPGVSWMDLFERVRSHTGSFVLLTQGHDPDLRTAFQNGQGFVLSRPIDEGQLNQICDMAAGRLKTSA